MFTLALVFSATIAISAIARVIGASKKVAIIAAMSPMAVLLGSLAASDALELGPHGGIVPAWGIVVFGLLTAFVAALIAAWLVRKNFPRGECRDSQLGGKTPNQSPETTRGTQP